MGYSQININFIEDYSRKVATQLADEFFIAKPHASGTDLITFCKIDQINLFVLLALFEEWKKEFEKIESPYFNYKAYDVKEATEAFMNVLSRNIQVSKTAILPLLEKAITNTILIGASPAVYFKKNFSDNTSETFKTDAIKQTEKYYRVNRFIITELIKRFDERYLTELNKIELKSHWDTVLQETAVQVNYDILNYLTFISPISESDILVKEEVKGAPFKAGRDESSPLSADLEPTLKQAAQTAVKENENSDEPVLLNKSGVNAFGVPLHEVFASQEHTTLNDTLKHGGTTVADSVTDKVVDIRSVLTINQKYMFINELFKGESWEFDRAMNRIGTCNDYDAAINMLLEDFADKYHWDTDNEQVAELFDLVSKKYN